MQRKHWFWTQCYVLRQQLTDNHLNSNHLCNGRRFNRKKRHYQESCTVLVLYPSAGGNITVNVRRPFSGSPIVTF